MALVEIVWKGKKVIGEHYPLIVSAFSLVVQLF